MKKALNMLAVLAITLSIVLSSCTGDSKKIIGEWKGMDPKGNAVSFIFDKDHTLTLITRNEVISGKEKLVNGHRMKITYETNESAKPATLDFVFTNVDAKKETKRIKGIFRYITDNKMELRIDLFGHTSFDTFNSEDKVHTLLLDKATN